MTKLARIAGITLLLGAAEETDLQRFPIDSLDGLISIAGVKLDRAVTVDANGSLELTAQHPTTFRLYETGDLDVEEAMIFYRARIKTRRVKGEAYLEMWCHFPGRGEFFSRGLQYSLGGTNHWVDVEAPFILRKGENPDNIKLNVVINGSGKVWIDDIRLVKAPPPPEV
jgi:hypothetical protein